MGMDIGAYTPDPLTQKVIEAELKIPATVLFPKEEAIRNAIEFYTTPEGEVTVKERGLPERQLNESDVDFIQQFLEVLENSIPEAYKALREAYAKYDGNRIFRDFSLSVVSSNVTSGCMTTRLI